MHFDPQTCLAFLTITGSHAYGTSTQHSDVDVRGVCVEPSTIRLSHFKAFEQHQGDLPAVRERLGVSETWDDCVVYELAKAVWLMADANPNMLELLWVPDDCILICDPRWDQILEIRDAFLSRKAKHTFTGYAHQQMRKIRTHRGWLLDPPPHEPTRAEYGLPEQSVLSADDRNRIDEAMAAAVRGWGVDDLQIDGAELDVLRDRVSDFLAAQLCVQRSELGDAMHELAGQRIGMPREILDALAAERRYRAARKHWESYQRWKSQRNRDRAQLEAQHGWDTKHGMHLLRLMRMGLEVIRDGVVRVRRDDAEDLLAVRRGERSYESVIEEALGLEEDIVAAEATSPLPREPARERIDTVLHEIIVSGWSTSSPLVG